jgi:hypothetical protein
MFKLKTSGRALPEVSEVKHKVVFGLPEAQGRQTICRLSRSGQYLIKIIECNTLVNNIFIFYPRRPASARTQVGSHDACGAMKNPRRGYCSAVVRPSGSDVTLNANLKDTGILVLSLGCRTRTAPSEAFLKSRFCQSVAATQRKTPGSFLPGAFLLSAIAIRNCAVRGKRQTRCLGP